MDEDELMEALNTGMEKFCLSGDANDELFLRFVFYTCRNPLEFLSKMDIQILKKYPLFETALMLKRFDILEFVCSRCRVLITDYDWMKEITDIEIFKFFEGEHFLRRNLVESMRKIFIKNARRSNIEMIKYIVERYRNMRYFKLIIRHYVRYRFRYRILSFLVENFLDIYKNTNDRMICINSEKKMELFIWHGLGKKIRMNHVDLENPNISPGFIRKHRFELDTYNAVIRTCPNKYELLKYSYFCPEIKLNADFFPVIRGDKMLIKFRENYSIHWFNSFLKNVFPKSDGLNHYGEETPYSFEERDEIINNIGINLNADFDYDLMEFPNE